MKPLDWNVDIEGARRAIQDVRDYLNLPAEVKSHSNTPVIAIAICAGLLEGMLNAADDLKK